MSATKLSGNFLKPFHSRIAPTPSGFLHIGNVFSFVITWLLVRKTQGSLLLRIDDLDYDRVRHEYIKDIFETLDWLGLDWDHGPQGVDDFNNHYSQIHRMDMYQALLTKLVKDPVVVYACDCSRTRIQELGSYTNICRYRRLPLDNNDSAWRMWVSDDTHVCWNELHQGTTHVECRSVTEQIGDFVVKRRNGQPAYQVASLADDLYFGSNCIVRGKDLLPSTTAQLWMAGLLAQTSFSGSVFYHHPVVMDVSKQKLSKSAGAMSVRSLRETSVQAGVVFRNLARSMGIPYEDIFTAQDLLQQFNFQLPQTLSPDLTL
ncbi:glutamate--tRNA ligase family protein [Xanthocytophaga flava]|uniref:glutamate--tRNA ligase family protein n=1 Tax=Xanthocytophaga flava TaxID=3048013 RepID=UPI0028D5EE3D|nr:glutamate--tRNA ligase family protein [Xanthocytophaga flavus]MDJ1468022.1 glutamate--tRNA ligase family protein [Xanthocytophaga flavus]